MVQKAQPEQWLVATKAVTAGQLNTMMQNVVNAGTATNAALQGIQVAGKTGTAEKGDGTNLAWFIGFAPAEDPQVCIAVVIEDTASTGGEVAAPLAAAVMKTALAQPSLPRQGPCAAGRTVDKGLMHGRAIERRAGRRTPRTTD